MSCNNHVLTYSFIFSSFPLAKDWNIPQDAVGGEYTIEVSYTGVSYQGVYANGMVKHVNLATYQPIYPSTYLPIYLIIL